MSLINTARALDDARFHWRVRGALLHTAAIRKDSERPDEIAYAEYLLAHPMQDSPTLASLCATDHAVAERVTVDSMNCVSTEGVLDETLIYIAEVNFGRLASDYFATINPV